MNIVVITPFDSANYGAYLQAFCLKEYLEKEGHIVEHLKVRSDEYVQSLFYHSKPSTRKEKYFPGYYRNQKSFGKEKYKIFKKAQKRFDIVDNISNADLAILGSDEIWNLRQLAFSNSSFWGFESVPTIAYAPSIGSATVDMFRDFPNHLEQLENIKRYLVRDEKTRQFVNQYTKKEADIVCDPTLLIPLKEYSQPMDDEYLENNQCLLIYSYKLSNSEIAQLKLFAKLKGLKTVSCCFNHTWVDHQINCDPLSFPELIAKSTYYFTTTFHGTIFGILTHANFVTMAREDKTKYLMDLLGVSSRLVNNTNLCDALKKLFEETIDYKSIDTKIQELRSVSVNSLCKAIVDIKNEGHKDKKYIDCFKNNCTGCFACRYVCPTNAISIISDSFGKTVPSVDEKKCINCGLCSKVCPQLNSIEYNMPMHCYAARGRDECKILNSSSGGIGYLIAEKMIQNNGVACGSVAKHGGAEHIIVDSLSDIERLKGSKYVQSDISSIYEDIKKILDIGKNMVFFGTPCQVSAIRRVFGTYENLFCVDVICHGVPPVSYLKDHLSAQVKSQSFDRFSFRGLPVDYTFKVYDKEKVIYQRYKDEDVYFYSFMKCISLRENCYNCKYAEKRRVGDMTIGDFWGINKSTISNQYLGNISLMLINTQKGNTLFELIKDELIFEERDYSEAVAGNPQLRRPSLRHSERNTFLRNYIKTHDFEEAMNATNILKEMSHARLGRTFPGNLLLKIKKAVF